jgi:hypothetical protein
LNLILRIRILFPISVILLLFLLNTKLQALQFNINDWSEPVNISELNSDEDDFAPVWNKFQNQFYFNSTRSGYSYFYTASFLKQQKFSEPVLLKSSLNKTGNNQSYITFLSADEAYLATFRKIENRPVMNIFKTFYRKNSWTEAVFEENLNNNSFSSYPSISPDGSTLVFVSNRNNSMDDLDLWMSSKLDDGNWSAPVKLDELNTPGREITPFLFSSHTLYFASDGFGGPGGFDIYYSFRIEGSWQKPRPVIALNTEFNESDFIILPNGTAFLASDRPGGKGKLDLFMLFPKVNEIRIEKQQIETSVRTQIASINAQKNSNVLNLPVQNFFTGNYFVNQKFENNNSVYDYFFAIPELIVKRMEDYPTAELYIQSTSYNDLILKYFENHGINKSKINFGEKATSDLIYFKTNDIRIFEPYSLNNNTYSLKPPVLDINLDSRNMNNIRKFSLQLLIGNNKINIKTSADTLPLRFYYEITNISDLIYSVDSLFLKFSVMDNFDENFDNYVNLRVNHSETKNKIITDSINNKKYIDYHIVIESVEKVEETFVNQSKYFVELLDDASINSGITIQYYDIKQQTSAQKLVDYINSKFKNKSKISAEMIKDKNNYKDLSSYIFRIRIFK